MNGVSRLLELWETHRDEAGHEIDYVHVHGCHLNVFQEAEGTWRWFVCCDAGRELSEGVAPTRMAAQAAAEDEVFAAHPPGGTWWRRLVGDVEE